jgi:hypothetical protein
MKFRFQLLWLAGVRVPFACAQNWREGLRLSLWGCGTLIGAMLPRILNERKH